ncbi:MAG: nuclear transport factor 2 family protein, partial [Gemmatimonadaceae bacterium]
MSNNTAAIANELVALCREGRNGEAVEKFYGSNIVSVESAGGPDGSPAETHGMDAVRGKGQWWVDNNEVHA